MAVLSTGSWPWSTVRTIGPSEEDLQRAGHWLDLYPCWKGRGRRLENHKPPAEISPRLLPSVASPQGVWRYFVFLEPCSGHHPKRAQCLKCCVFSSLVSDLTRQDKLQQQMGAFLGGFLRRAWGDHRHNHQQALTLPMAVCWVPKSSNP